MNKKPSRPPRKPTGTTGPFEIRADGIIHHPVQFPESKPAIEDMIARLFVKNAGTMPIGLAPFSDLVANKEYDLDFSIKCGDGQNRLLELAEFAPLQELGVSYNEAPRQMDVKEMANLTLGLIDKKSKRQGGTNRLLLLYKTHDAFFISPPVQELLRRLLHQKNPAFDAVYFLSPQDTEQATVFEIWPGKPHSFFENLSDEALSNLRLVRGYPDEFKRQESDRRVFYKRRL